MSRAVKKVEDENTQLAFMLGDVGGGMESTDSDTFAIPFLTVLQKGSPQVDEADGRYVEGAKAGMFFNSVTGELYDGKVGVTFLQCAFQRRYIHWGPRAKEGGGFKGEHLVEKVHERRDTGELVQLEGRLYIPHEDGSVDPKTCDYFADVRNHYGILVTETSLQQVLLSLASTQIKKSRQIMSMLNGVKLRGPNGLVTPPTWGSKIHLSTVPESNDKGSWHGIKAQLDGFLDDEDLYNAAKEFNRAIMAGSTRAAYESTNEADDRF